MILQLLSIYWVCGIIYTGCLLASELGESTVQIIGLFIAHAIKQGYGDDLNQDEVRPYALAGILISYPLLYPSTFLAVYKHFTNR